jgi:glucose-6-phosphate 1-epimerase
VQLAEGVVASRRFEQALHTYLRVGDIHQVSVDGLEACAYVDKVGEVTEKETGKPIRFTEETDCVYKNTTSECVLHDSQLARQISVSKLGSASTVIWNPWIEKSRRMPDFGDDEWNEMVCIETANVGQDAIQLEPHQIHTMMAEISCLDLSILDAR